MTNPCLKLYLFNVGGGDHLMLEFSNGAIGIIDCFYTNSVLGLQEPPALTYLKCRVDTKIKSASSEKVVISFIALSHADLDHIKHIEMIFDFIQRESEHVQLDNLWLFGGIDLRQFSAEIEKLNSDIINSLGGDAQEEFEMSAKSYLSILARIDEFRNYWVDANHKTESYFSDFSEFIKYGDCEAFRAFSLAPLANIIRNQTDESIHHLIRMIYERVQPFQNKFESVSVRRKYNLNRNAISAVLGIRTKDYNLIFGGDATKEVLQASINDITKRWQKKEHGDLLNPDFLKVSHHGAKGSTSPQLWDTLFRDPKGDLLLGISAGKNQKYLHPHSELYRDVSACCDSHQVRCNIYRTNSCPDCKVLPRLDDEENLDDWFRYHGCETGDSRLDEDFANQFTAREKSGTNILRQGLLAYVFYFPNDGCNKDIKVHRGLSTLVGNYDCCVYGEQNEYYCKSKAR